MYLKILFIIIEKNFFIYNINGKKLIIHEQYGKYVIIYIGLLGNGSG